MTVKKKCPECQRDDGLAVVRTVQGLEECQFISEDGPVWDGHTEILSDTAVTVGVACQECYWQYEGQDWMNKLLS